MNCDHQWLDTDLFEDHGRGFLKRLCTRCGREEERLIYWLEADGDMRRINSDWQPTADEPEIIVRGAKR
jgi:hypothetical protein